MAGSDGTPAITRRLAGALYLDPLWLRGVRIARNAARDLWSLGPLVALGSVWASTRSEAVVPRYLWSAPPVLIDWLLDWHAARWFPVAVASLVYLVTLHVGANTMSKALRQHPVPVRGGETPDTERAVQRAHRNQVVRSILFGLAVFIFAVVALSGGPGDTQTQYLPLAVAVVLGFVVRRWRRKFPFYQLWRPTRCGFRPSWRPAVNLNGYAALQECDLANFVAPVLLTTGALETFASARDVLLKYRDPHSAAWCVARAVDYCVQLGDLPSAERFLDEADAVPVLSGHRIVLSAKALFFHDIGQPKIALRMLEKIQVDLGWRTPRRLRDQIQFIQANMTSRVTQGAVRGYRRLAWHAQCGEIARWIILDARTCLPDEALTALAASLAIDQGNEAIQNEFADDTELATMLSVAADVSRLRGDCFRALRLHHHAAAAYLESYEKYLNIRDRDATAECLLRSAVEMTLVGYPNSVRLLDIFRFGLHLLESARTGLRHSATRVAALARRQELYTEVFDAIAEHLYLADPRRAGEICFWLIESQQRNALASAIRAGGIDLDENLRARLDNLESAVRVVSGHDDLAKAAPDLIAAGSPAGEIVENVMRAYSNAFTDEAVDLNDVMAQLGGNCAILYDSSQDSSGWSFRTVVVSPLAGITVHSGRVERSPTDERRSWQLTPVGVLDALAAGAAEKVTTVSSVPLDDAVWAEIADAVLPPALVEVLRRHAAQQPDATLLVVPDGPIAALPFPGLRLRDGSMLIDHVSVAFTPSLTLLAASAYPTRPTTASVHINSATLKHTTAQSQLWRTAHDGLSVRMSNQRKVLRATLEATPRPDFVVIATHGYTTPHAVVDSIALADGSILSAATALSWPWPPLVMLGSCWTAQVRGRRGQEPFGFPVACLLGGAQTVVSASAPIVDETADDLLARLDEDIIAGRDVLGSLRHHTTRLLDDKAWLRDAPPSWWATLISWTVRSPATSPIAAAPFAATYDLEGISPETDQPDTGSFSSSESPRIRQISTVPWSTRTVETLQHRYGDTGMSCITTLDFVDAAIAADLARAADWTAFTVACGVSDRPNPRWSRCEDTDALTELTLSDSSILVSIRLARAIEIGGQLAADLHDQSVEPWHVLFGVIADPGADATRWLSSGAEPVTHVGLIDVLGVHLFNLQLPEPMSVGLPEVPDEEVPPFSEPPTTAASRLLEILAAVAFRPRVRRCATAAVVLLVLVAGAFLRDMATVRDVDRNTAFAGIVTQMFRNADGSITTDVVGTVPSSPAELAGLNNGDVVLSVDGDRRPTPASITAAVKAHRPGDVIEVTIDRGGATKTTVLILSDLETGLGLINNNGR